MCVSLSCTTVHADAANAVRCHAPLPQVIWCYIICFVELFLVAGAFSHEYSGNLAYALPSACKPEACTPIRVLACVPGRTCGAPP